ncbi:hypothetical protein [Metabacillus bambusae]|uniref:Uncharacterized protein n=1 Tax=Metabacillus bambusae TaxID=2795218 RepID=A0ABS3N214_9BACI|nr:hypothetical protein [Metabacillus bambusae]MBO1512139.1 hypothetical protein [Metabacillus bambusae]
MEILANLPYIIITRSIENNIQFQREEEHEITLSSQRVCTSFDSFLLDEVLDISYRFFSKDMGFLYLHTTKGMHAYAVKISPQPFIEKFKSIK